MKKFILLTLAILLAITPCGMIAGQPEEQEKRVVVTHSGHPYLRGGAEVFALALFGYTVWRNRSSVASWFHWARSKFSSQPQAHTNSSHAQGSDSHGNAGAQELGETIQGLFQGCDETFGMREVTPFANLQMEGFFNAESAPDVQCAVIEFFADGQNAQLKAHYDTFININDTERFTALCRYIWYVRNLKALPEDLVSYYRELSTFINELMVDQRHVVDRRPTTGKRQAGAKASPEQKAVTSELTDALAKRQAK